MEETVNNNSLRSIELLIYLDELGFRTIRTNSPTRVSIEISIFYQLYLVHRLLSRLTEISVVFFRWTRNEYIWIQRCYIYSDCQTQDRYVCIKNRIYLNRIKWIEQIHLYTLGASICLILILQYHSISYETSENIYLIIKFHADLTQQRENEKSMI